jgi:hypothetical protein
MIDGQFVRVAACAVVGGFVGTVAFEEFRGPDSAAIGAATGAIVSAIAASTALLCDVFRKDRSTSNPTDKSTD